MAELHQIAPFFSGWDETMIWSCLQGRMGYFVTDHEENPSAAQIVLGDFCYFAGMPNRELVARAAAPIIVPQDEEWGSCIESVWGSGVTRALRYAIKKEPDVFQSEQLQHFAESLDCGYDLRLIDEEIYDYLLRNDWSRDLCSQFADYEEYHKNGLGVAVIHQGEAVCGASSYSFYQGGIEIEIDTKPEFRRKGLATACGARLILECLARGLYPSWDAHDLRSVALAEKLGYHMDHPYTVYLKQ